MRILLLVYSVLRIVSSRISIWSYGMEIPEERKMRTEVHLDNIRKGEFIIRSDRSPDELWLDQDITGEELIKLDPLQETEDLMALAQEGMGYNDSLRCVPEHPYSDSLWQLMWRVLKAELRAKHGGSETAAEFITRLRGSK